MADDPNNDLPSFAERGSPTLQQLADYTIEQALQPDRLKKIEATLGNSGATMAGAVLAGIFPAVKGLIAKYGAPLAGTIVKALLDVLEASDPITEEVAKVALDSVLGRGVARAGVPGDVGHIIIEKLSPAGESIEPSLDPAAGYMTTMVSLQMETWLLGMVAELLGDAVSMVDVGGATLRSMAELRDVVTQVFGGGRLTRRVLAPIIDDSIVQPAKRFTQRKYRPQLLGVSESIRAYLRGDWEIDRITEESSQQGYSDERLQVLVENARKRLTIDELIFRHFRGEISDVETANLARGLEYDEATTLAKIAIKDAERVDALQAPIVSEAIANYIAGDIDVPALEQWVNGAAPNATDAARLISGAKARRAINVKHISSTRMRALVLEGIASVVDYTAALQRENYPPDEIVLEELSLRVEQGKKQHPPKKDPALTQLETAVVDGAIDLATLQSSPAFRALTDAGQAIELAIVQAKVDKRAADEQAKLDAAAKRAEKDAELEAKRSRVYPALTEYRTAFVRGYIDRSTYAAALTREKVVDDDAAFLLAGADADREKWLTDQAKRDQALADAEHKGLSLAAREQAVVQGILTLQEFDASLAKDKLDDDARHLLVELLQAKLDDAAAAKAKHDEAAAAAAAKDASLAEWDHAVLLGVRTLDQYAAFVATLPLNDAARALVVDALRAQLAAADQAKATRVKREPKAQTIGISLAQRRRAVIAGVRPKQYYADALVAAGWPIDDQLADLDLLDTEIDAAAAARAKRDAVVVKVTPSLVSVSQLERALTLGLITPAEFTDALSARGATADDAALLVQLAVAKVPDARAAAQLHVQVAAQLAAKGVALADLDKAVLRGLVTLDAYGTDLAGRGYGEDAVALLVQLLQDRLDVDVDGLTRKLTAALAKADGAPTLAELQQQLVAGAIDTTAFQGVLVDAGAPRDAALVYARLVTSGEVGA